MKKLFFASLVMMFFFTQFSYGTSLLKNGSFERGTEFWVSSVTDLCTAKFLPDPVYTEDGISSLRVVVSKNNKAKPNGVSITNQVVLPQKDSIYLLTFRAKSYSIGNLLNDKMDMNVYIECTDTTYKVRYVIRNGSYLYYFPFKTRSKIVKVRFSFPVVGTYYLDALELVAEDNDTNMDVRKTYVWNNNRKQSDWQWVAGDNDVSLALPGGETVWFFNDCFYGKDSPEDNQVYPDRFMRNAMVVQGKDDILTTRWYGDQKTSNVYFPVQDTILKDGKVNNLFWVGDALFDPKESKVKVYLIDLNMQNGGCEGTGKTYMAEFSYPGLVYLGMKKQAPSLYRYETFFVEKDTIYFYMAENDAWTQWTHIARTPLSNILGDKEPIQHYDGTGWTTDSTKSARINHYRPESVVKFAEGNYAQISGAQIMGNVDVSFAQHPEGPWSNAQTLYKIPVDSTYNHYMPNFHGTLSDGKYSVSYSVNCGEPWVPSWRNKFFYRQRYVQADLMAMSPFTKKDCAGIINGTAYVDNCQECVAGTTGKTACVTGPAVVYPDCGFGGKAVALKAGSYTQSALLSAGIINNDIASMKVMDGYRAELYSENNYTGDKLILTSDSSCLDNAAFTDLTTSIIISRIGSDTIGGSFKLRNAQNGLYLDCEDGTPFKETVIQNIANETGSQVFRITSPSKGFYNIQTYNEKSIQTAASEDGSFLDLKMTIASSSYQQFCFKMVGKDSVKIYSRKIDKLLEGVPGANPGAFARVWTDIDQLSGVWILEVPNPTALVENKNTDQIRVSPNPVQNTMYVFGTEEGCAIKLMNLQGQIVLSQKEYKNGVDVSSLPKGMYILNVSQGKQIKSIKVMVK